MINRSPMNDENKGVIPAKAEILMRVIILQLVCLLSVNRGEVIVVTAEMSN